MIAESFQQMSKHYQSAMVVYFLVRGSSGLYPSVLDVGSCFWGCLGGAVRLVCLASMWPFARVLVLLVGVVWSCCWLRFL
jgi:hypothetical protein